MSKTLSGIPPGACGTEMQAKRPATRKRSIYIQGHKTSVSLEDGFWTGLKDIANERRVPLTNLIIELDKARTASNLSSAIRIFVLNFYKSQAEQPAQAGK